ncbi:Gfo/Idh/MocA family oxidoreductase [Microbacterium sp.]|uniref:Gfo/Idh/MocA family oxidoreductase n=1 Tax=Microbacterium sp. TaxID=51671 RepID=UPI002811F9BE|nr:Gfo/Idh/MocA family oxidoreductase [Microbacterium sp.]
MAARVGFAGVAHSHPFTDAENLRTRGVRLAGVWDADDPRRLDEFTRRFDVPVCTRLNDLLEDGPDVVVATPRTPRAAEVARACASAGIPVFFNKTVAADAAGLDIWDHLPAGRRFTTSVLRFAPSLVRLADDMADRTVHAIDVHVQHDIADFLVGARRWQDAPDGAGGTLMNLGIHAWEMLDVLLPGSTARMLSATAARGSADTASELVATVHAEVEGRAVSVTVSGVGGADRYAVRVTADDGVHDVRLPQDPEGLGYHGTADAILQLAREEEEPVAAERTASVYRNAIAATELARRRIIG